MLAYLEDSLDGFANGAAGVRLTLVNPLDRTNWVQNNLRKLFRVFEPRSSDVSVCWLRPLSSPKQLELFASENLKEPNNHYKYRLGEGLAGRVWQAGEPASHHPSTPNRWWKERVGCENAVYVCAPVGPSSETGGVIGVGSNAGFELAPEDEQIVCTFASILAPVAGAQRAGVDGRRQLRLELEQLRAKAKASKSRETVSAEDAGEFNRLLIDARQISGTRPRIEALGSVDPDGRESYGEIDAKLRQLLRAITPA